MKKILFLLAATTLIILSGCNSKSLEDKFNKKTYAEDISKLTEKKLLNESEKTLLTSYIISNTQDSLVSLKSYSELLSAAKTEDVLKKAIDEKKKKLDKSLTIKVTRKYTQNFLDGGYVKNFLLVEIVAKNNTDKQISGFTVKINFKNADGIAFYTAEWPVVNVLKAKSKITIPLSTGEFQNTNIYQAKLKMADMSKIKVEYEILQLMYDDGTSLSIN